MSFFVRAEGSVHVSGQVDADVGDPKDRLFNVKETMGQTSSAGLVGGRGTGNWTGSGTTGYTRLVERFTMTLYMHIRM